jgi:hypothetical protein
MTPTISTPTVMIPIVTRHFKTERIAGTDNALRQG